MGDIVAVLLIPSPEYAEALLRDGPCGARMPTAEFRCCRYGHTESGQWCGPDTAPATCQHTDHPSERLRPLLLGTERALVLAWEGAPVPEGLFRASSLMEGLPGWEPSDYIDYYNPWDCDDLDAVLYRARMMAGWGLGRLALLDANGREVTP